MSMSHSSKRAGRLRMAGLLAVGGLVALPAVSLGSSAAAQTVPPFGFYSSWDSSWSFNAYAVNYALTSNPMFVDLPLAFQLQPSGKWDPQLARSWRFVGNKLEVMLQPNAKWQNGRPVTSTDVVDSYLLGLSAGWAWGSVATGISAVNTHEVAFTLRATSLTTRLPITKPTVLSSILPDYVEPAAVYGKLATPKLRSLVHADLTASAKSASKAITGLGLYDKTLTAYNPAAIWSDGPFQFKSITTNQISLVKNPRFFGAAKIHVPSVLLWNSGNNSALSTTELFAGQLDFSWPTNTLGLVKRWKSAPYHHFAKIPTLLGESFYFNDHLYPLNNVKVRQALLYATNRADVSIAGEGFRANTVSSFETGLPHGLRTTWLGSNSAMIKAGFNPYTYNPAKARRLLKSAGFHYRNSTWYTPKGKPFTISITTPSGWGSTQLNASNLASQWSAFGIKTTASSVEQPGYWTDVLDGNFDVAWNWDGFSNINPIDALYGLLAGENYVPAKNERGMGFGPSVVVPGLGKVNLATSLTGYGVLAKRTKIRQITEDYTKMVNQDVPFIQFDTKDSQTYWSTQNYVDWPPLSNKALWDTAGDTPQETVPLMMEAGYIRPK